MNSSLRKKLSVLSCALITLVSVAPGGAQAKPNWEKFDSIVSSDMFSGQKINLVQKLAGEIVKKLNQLSTEDYNNKEAIKYYMTRIKNVTNPTFGAMAWKGNGDDKVWDDIVEWSEKLVIDKQTKEEGIAAMIKLGLIEEEKEEEKPNPNEIEDADAPVALKPSGEDQEGQPAQPATDPTVAPKQPIPAQPKAYHAPTKPTFPTPSSDPSTPAREPGMPLGKKVFIGVSVATLSAIIAAAIYLKANKKGPFAPGNQTSLIKH